MRRQRNRCSTWKKEKKLLIIYTKTLSETLSSADYILSKVNCIPLRKCILRQKPVKNLKTISSLYQLCLLANTKVYYLEPWQLWYSCKPGELQQKKIVYWIEWCHQLERPKKTINRFRDVMLMTFSEFGRRAAQNASGGTDHGTANNMFCLSGQTKSDLIKCHARP